MKQIRSFFLGVFGALAALFLELLIFTFFTPLSFSLESEKINTLFFSSIIIEELVKYLTITRIVSKFSGMKNIALNSIFLGFGFSAIEGLLIFWKYQGSSFLSISSIIGIVLIHISTSAIMGYLAGSKMSKSLVGLFGALILHSTYNILKLEKFSGQEAFIFTLILVAIFIDIYILIASRKRVSLAF